MPYSRTNRKHIWNEKNQRFEAVYEEELLPLPEVPPIQFCRLHEPVEWQQFRGWLHQYNRDKLSTGKR